MKILFVNNGLAGGGAEKLINDLLPRFLSRGHNCELLILSAKNEKYLNNLTAKGITITAIPESIKTHIGKMRFIWKYVLSGKYDIVHANTFPTIYYCSLIKKIHKKHFPKLVMTEHNTDNRRRHRTILRPLEKYIYKSYDKVISISDKTQECLLDWLRPKKTDKFVVVNNGVPIDDYKNATPMERRVISEHIKGSEVLICMVGSFTEQKNHDVAIEVIEKLPNHYKLVLLGEGPLKDRIKQRVSEKHIEDKVVFMGFRKDVPAIVKTCDISIVPSKWEGFGLVAVEAMACGKPVVASNVPGLAEVVGEYGMLCEPDSADSFAKRIMSLRDIEKYNYYSKKGTERAVEFDIEFMTEKYEEIYVKLAAEKA